MWYFANYSLVDSSFAQFNLGYEGKVFSNYLIISNSIYFLLSKIISIDLKIVVTPSKYMIGQANITFTDPPGNYFKYTKFLF